MTKLYVNLNSVFYETEEEDLENLVKVLKMLSNFTKIKRSWQTQEEYDKEDKKPYFSISNSPPSY